MNLFLSCFEQMCICVHVKQSILHGIKHNVSDSAHDTFIYMHQNHSFFVFSGVFLFVFCFLKKAHIL